MTMSEERERERERETEGDYKWYRKYYCFADTPFKVTREHDLRSIHAAVRRPVSANTM